MAIDYETQREARRIESGLYAGTDTGLPQTQTLTATLVSTYIDPTTGDVVGVYSDGTTSILSKGTKLQDEAAAAAAKAEADRLAAQAKADAKKEMGQSAYDLLYAQFQQYGLGSLVEPLKQFIVDGLSPAEFTIRLRDTDAYKKRFAANAQRIAKGLAALSEAEYINQEDMYQEVMRRYGLPESFYAKTDLGVQPGFEKLMANGISVSEVEDRIQSAQNRVINNAPEIAKTLRQFYPELSNGDLIAYVLDPEQTIGNIKRKITAAEIGAGALMSGLSTGVTRAEELQRYGVTGEQARQGYQTVADVVPRGSQLAEFYKQTPYTQTTAEAEVFGVPGATEAAKQRKKLTQLEQASFSGQAGVSQGALARDRAGAF